MTEIMKKTKLAGLKYFENHHSTKYVSTKLKARVR